MRWNVIAEPVVPVAGAGLVTRITLVARLLRQFGAEDLVHRRLIRAGWGHDGLQPCE